VDETPDNGAAVVENTNVNPVSESTAEPPGGWGLSGKGSDDATEPEEKPFVPAPDMSAEGITTAQAKKVSALLLKEFDNPASARAWLKKAAQVERTTHLRTNQYEALMTAIARHAKGASSNA
jgi:hypothetical protein